MRNRRTRRRSADDTPKGCFVPMIMLGWCVAGPFMLLVGIVVVVTGPPVPVNGVESDWWIEKGFVLAFALAMTVVGWWYAYDRWLREGPRSFRGTDRNRSPEEGRREAKLPMGVKFIGIGGILYGAWNVLLAPVALSTTKEFSKFSVALPNMKVVLAVNAALAAYALIVCIALLRRREWGRKCVIYGLCLLLAGGVGWAAIIFYMNGLGRPSVYFYLVGTAIGVAAFGTPIIFGIRYLGQERIRRVFRSGIPGAGAGGHSPILEGEECAGSGTP